MPTLLQINVTANWGSTGKIAEEIGKAAIEEGWQSYIAYGRKQHGESSSELIRIGTDFDIELHGLQTRVFDRHGLGSIGATRKFIKRIKEIKPDIIHLHNIHGYYLNYPVLFDFLKQWGGPVVWTLHDIWSFTGHCSYFSVDECDKWKNQCGKCPHLKIYPASLFFDSSKSNYTKKKQYFNSVKNLTLVPVSNWLSELLDESFLNNINRKTIHNGIDTCKFSLALPKEVCRISALKYLQADLSKKYVIAIANVWTTEKGFDDLINLRNYLPDNYIIVMVGVNNSQIKLLPQGIIGVTRTSKIEELAMLYSGASAFLNPTYGDNFPTVNIEALACGTPVITYNTGGSPEAIDRDTGIVVKKGDVKGLRDAILAIDKASGRFDVLQCRERAVNFFDKKDRYNEYIELYNKLLDNKYD